MGQTKISIIKIGITVTLALTILLLGMNYLKGKTFLSTDNIYYVIYERIDGLERGNPVQINGFKIGQVKEIEFTADGTNRLLVSLGVKKKYKIHKTAQARLASSDIMGSKAIQILQGESTENHQSYDTLASDIENDLMEEVNMQILPIKSKAESLMLSFDSLLVAVNAVFNQNTRDNLSKSFASIQATINNLERTTLRVDNLVATEQKRLDAIVENILSISDNLKNNNQQITHILSNFDAISDSIAQSDIRSTINNANNVLATVNGIMSKIERGEGTLGMLVKNDTLYTNLQNVTYNVNRLVRDLNDNPKRYINFSAFDLGRTVYIVREEDKPYLRKEKKKSEKQLKDE